MSIGRVNRSIHDLQGMFVSTTRVQQRLVMKHLLLEVTLKLLLLDGEVQKPRCPALAFHGVLLGHGLGDDIIRCSSNVVNQRKRLALGLEEGLQKGLEQEHNKEYA